MILIVSCKKDSISIDEMHKQMYFKALSLTKGNVLAASKILGVSERTMWNNIPRYGMNPFLFKPIKQKK